MNEAQLHAILADVSFRNSALDFEWRFCTQKMDLESVAGSRRGWLVWAEFQRPDTNTGAIGIGRGREEIVWEDATESGVVKTAWLLVELLIRHELMEGFRYQGRRPFDPHNDIQALNSLQEGRKE